MTIPGPLVFGFYTAVHAAIALLALRLLPVMPAAALSLFVVEAVTAYDSLIVVLGKRMGPGPAAERLNRMRFLLHAVCIGLLVPVYVAIGDRLAVPGLAGPAALPIAFAAAGAIAAFGWAVQYRGLRQIMPVDSFGCMRYAQSVEPGRHWPGYAYTEAELAARPLPPFASIITVLVGLVVSLWVGWSAGFWAPFVVTALMFTASAFPAKAWGPLLTSLLEIVYSAGLYGSLATLAAGP